MEKRQLRIFLYQYGAMEFLKNYVEALNGVGACPVVDNDIGTALHCDGLLLPGGGDSDPSFYGQKNTACFAIDIKRDLQELALIARFAAAKKPILGICRGHQLLNIAFGGDLIQDLTAKELHIQKEGQDQFHDTNIAQKSFLAELYGSHAKVCSAHHQGIGRLGRGFSAVQWTKDGTVEAISHAQLPILGVQWHPERQGFSKWQQDAADGAMLFSYFLHLCEQRRCKKESCI